MDNLEDDGMSCGVRKKPGEQWLDGEAKDRELCKTIIFRLKETYSTAKRNFLIYVTYCTWSQANLCFPGNAV